MIVHYGKYADIDIEDCKSVYRPAEDTFLLMDYLIPGNRVLEVGCGTGIISVYCAKLGRNVTCCDISDAALDCTEKNVIRNKVTVEVINSSLFDNIEGKFDTIIFNPPYLPVEDRIEDAEQWNGGKEGFDVIRPFLKRAKSFLEVSGSIYLILSSLTDINRVISEFPEYSFNLVASDSYFFETIFLYHIFPRP